MRVYSQAEASVKIGEEFGRLRVIGTEFRLWAPNASTRLGVESVRYVVVQCLCESILVVRVPNLKRGTSRSSLDVLSRP